MSAIKKIEAAFDAEFICYEFPSEQQRDTARTMFRLGYRAALASKEAELAEAGLKYVSLFGELQNAMAEIAKLQALSVTNIMLDVVPGFDGMGEEVYAKSVKEVEDRLSSMGEELEDWQLGIRRYDTTNQQPTE